MKRLFFLLIVISLSVVFGACPPLEEDEPDSYAFGNTISVDDLDLKDPDQDEADTKLDVYKWFKILDKVARERKYVSLDLSKGTYVEDNKAGGLIKVTVDDGTFDQEYLAFDPFPAASSGKNYILSIILPKDAQMISQAVEDSKLAEVNYDEEIKNSKIEIEDIKKNSAFRFFTKLRSVKAENVELIGNFAFADCTSLKEVDFPRAGHIVSDVELQDNGNTMLNGYRLDVGKYAFLGCTGLTDVKFNSAAVIGKYAFKNCTSLLNIDFPEAWMIERNAFDGCENLENVFFEKVSKIGKEAFKKCTSLLKAEFNVEPKRFTSGGPSLTADPENPCVYDSVIFYPSVFTGCKALGVLNIRRAWNVYFSIDVLADIGSAIEIYLLDVLDGDDSSYGHPQDAKFLGGGVLEGGTNSGPVTVKKVNILVPALDSPDNAKIQGNKAANNIASFIRTSYTLDEINVNKR